MLRRYRVPNTHVALDHALVLVAPRDFEVPVLAPVSAPRVGDQPVRHAVLRPPPGDLGRVGAEEFACLVHIHV